MPGCNRGRRRRSRRRREHCAECGRAFWTRHSQGKYCSPACAREGARRSWREYGDRNRDSRRAYHRRHYKKNAARIIAKAKAYHKTPAGRRAMKKSGASQRAKFPEKYRARQAVAVALRSGHLTRRPCQKCWEMKVQAHHENYAKPLEVTWLCGPCHMEIHAA